MASMRLNGGYGESGQPRRLLVVKPERDGLKMLPASLKRLMASVYIYITALYWAYYASSVGRRVVSIVSETRPSTQGE